MKPIILAMAACLSVQITLQMARAESSQEASDVSSTTIDADGSVHVPAMMVPFSSLASNEAKKLFLEHTRIEASIRESKNIDEARRRLDDLLRPGIEELRVAFPVTVTRERIGGVQVDVIDPARAVPSKNKRRVLISLHGGAFVMGGGLGGQAESIPIASLGGIEVIKVDYRLAPEYKFPAASEDVAAVYRELLKKYPAENIGIYGCSAGGILTAESVAWFQAHDLPKPGAIGIFGAGALVPMPGDSNYFASPLLGDLPLPEDAKKVFSYFDVRGLDIESPLVSPVYSPSVLAGFPPTLLLTSTRDFALSSSVYTHAKLINEGIAADLHVWEGPDHCFFTESYVDLSAMPEAREVWDVITRFFNRHLGSK